MNIVWMARQAGLEITLDARIGKTEYTSVHGSMASLERFVECIRAALEREPLLPDEQQHVADCVCA